MTGLDPSDDVILEVAAIITDWDFKEIATYEGVVRHPDATLTEKLAANAGFWDANPAARDGLIAQNEQGKSLEQVETELIDFIDEHIEDPQVLLAGNSIHQDRQFIRSWWPLLEQRLHYRMLDVSAWKVVFEGKFRKKFAKPESHRALEDIRGSVAELKYYLGKVRGV